MSSTEPRPLTLACAQMDGCGGAREERLERIAGFARRAAARHADLLVLPEMSVDGYDLSRQMAGAPLPGPVTDALVEIARDADLYLVAGATERRGADRFNALALVGPDGYVGAYRKLHVSAVENAFWRCGRGGEVLSCDLGRVGFGICADMIFPTPWRGYRDAVDLVVIGAAWPDHHHTRPFPYGAWFSEVHARATRDVPLHVSRALGVPVAFANAAGSFDARLPPFGSALSGRFAGRSCVADGEVLAQAEADAGEALVVATTAGERRAPPQALEPWIPSWSRGFRVASRGGDTALGLLSRAFYRSA